MVFQRIFFQKKGDFLCFQPQTPLTLPISDVASYGKIQVLDNFFYHN